MITNKSLKHIGVGFLAGAVLGMAGYFAKAALVEGDTNITVVVERMPHAASPKGDPLAVKRDRLMDVKQAAAVVLQREIHLRNGFRAVFRPSLPDHGFHF